MDLTPFRDLYDQWHDFAGAVFSFIFAVAAWLSRRSSKKSADQAHQSAEIARRALHTTANQFAAQLVITAGQVFIEHPELRPYFEAKREIEEGMDEKDQDRIEAAALTQLDVMETIWDHHEEMNQEDIDAWREWIHDLFERSPVLRNQYKPTWYPSINEMFAEHLCTDAQHSYAKKQHEESEKAHKNQLDKLRADLAAKTNDVDKLEALRKLASAQMRTDPEAAAVMAAAYHRHARERDFRGRKGVFRNIGFVIGQTLGDIFDRLRTTVAHALWGPPRSLDPDLHALITDETYESSVQQGRSKSLASALEYAAKKTDKKQAP